MITEIIKGKEYKLNNKYNYVGPGTPIDNYILNLKHLETFYNRFNFIAMDDVEYKNLFTRPSYDIDYICCEHDIYYWIASRKTISTEPVQSATVKKSMEVAKPLTPLEEELKIQHHADDILIKKCYKLLQNKKHNDPERNDILIVMQLINLKLKVEDDLKKCKKNCFCKLS